MSEKPEPFTYQSKKHEGVIPLLEPYIEEESRDYAFVGCKRKRVLHNFLTTASYQDSLIFDARLFKRLIFQIIEKNGAQSIFYKVLACIDDPGTGGNWEEIIPETSIAAGGSDWEWLEGQPWCFYKIQVKNNSGVGKVTAYIAGKVP